MQTKNPFPPAVLALADGSVYHGFGFGALRSVESPVVAEIVFNTSMSGYQEILTDPSYAGQALCFTAPHIGNVGCNAQDVESSRVYAEALLIRDRSRIASNFRSQQSLEQYLQRQGTPGIFGIDTRQLVAHLRDQGAQMGAIACVSHEQEIAQLVARARAESGMLGRDMVRAVSCKEPYAWNSGSWQLGDGSGGGSYKTWSQTKLASRPHVVVIDCGVKHAILRLLLDVGFRVGVVPAGYTAKQILELRPDALFLSNGPGDPATLGYVVEPVRELLGKLPIFGICLGHQILAQALGGRTYKLKFGHRGGNHPVMDLTTGKVEITVQNHGFAVDAESLKRSGTQEAQITHLNLNDQTVEGLAAPGCRAFSVQYHPEASPGPHDARYLFRRFFESVVTE